MPIPYKFFKMFWNDVEKKDYKRFASQTPVAGVKEECDIPYTDDAIDGHLFDFYYPENRGEKKLPLIIDIHGGGWVYGFKEINKNYCYYLASKGFTVMNVNYRLSPEAKTYEQVRDIFKALDWIDKNGDKNGCDMNNVFITGDSAGGHLAAVVTAVMARPDLAEKFRVKKPSFDFNAAGYTCGAFDIDLILKIPALREYAEQMMGKNYEKNPYIKYVNMSDILTDCTNMPPIWMISSKEDFIGFLSKKFDRDLSEHGIFHIFHVFPKSPLHPLPHVFNISFPEYNESMEANDEMLTFFKAFIK